MLTTNLRWLYLGRALRSFGTAFLTVVFPLYLAVRGDSATEIGAILTGGTLLSAALMAVIGLAGDRFGRRPMLIGLGLAGVVGGLALAGTANVAVVVLASGLGGVGRGGGAGSGGSWGPFFPAEQPLLTASVTPERRTAAFGQIGFVGVLAAAAGSLVAWIPASLHSAGWSWVAAYQMVFLLGAAVSVVVVMVSLPLREPKVSRVLEHEPTRAAQASSARSSDASGAAEVADPRSPAGLSTRQLVGRLGLTNALNGLGFGFLGPLLTYWFHARYGVGPAELGVLYTVVNLVTALPYLGAARIARRLGAVRAVVLTRAIGTGFILVMAFMPTFGLAGAVFAVRMALNSLGLPARQSYTMGVADERRRGTVAALGGLPSMVTSSISPVVGGALMGVFLETPLVGAAVFMGANTIAYYMAFRHNPTPEEAERNRRASHERSDPERTWAPDPEEPS